VVADAYRLDFGPNPLDDPTSTQESLYNLPESDFNQITTGYNGFNAGAGYNLVTGLGTPIANQLIPDLIANTVSANSQRGITVTASDLQAYVGVGGSGDIANEMNVFDAVLISSPNSGISRTPTQEIVVATEPSSLAGKTSTILLLNDHGKKGSTESTGNSDLPIHGDNILPSVAGSNSLPATGTGTQQTSSSETAIVGSGNVLLLNGPNNDSLLASAGDGLPFGGTGNDVTISGTGNEVLVGGEGSDLMIGAAGHDMMIGGFGGRLDSDNGLSDEQAASIMGTPSENGNASPSSSVEMFEVLNAAVLVTADGTANSSMDETEAS
jgi:Ca2+-binding RTX toxin-like protein